MGLALFSVWCNVGLGVLYGRLLDVNPDQMAPFLSFQDDVHEQFPGGASEVAFGSRLPAPRLLTTFVVGRCRGLYWSDGLKWTLVESSERLGHFRLRVRFPKGPTGLQPFVIGRHGRDKPEYLAVRTLAGNRVQFSYDGVFPEPPIALGPRADHRVDVLLTRQNSDRVDGDVLVAVDGRLAYSTVLPNRIIPERLRTGLRFTVGHATIRGVAPQFTGSIEHLPAEEPLCRRLVRQHEAGRVAVGS